MVLAAMLLSPGKEEVEQYVLPGQQRLCPLQVQQSQGERECIMILTQPKQVKIENRFSYCEIMSLNLIIST